VRKNDLKKQTKRRKQKLQQKRKQLKCTLKSTQHLDKNIIHALHTSTQILFVNELNNT